jgi:hypothetical protein
VADEGAKHVGVGFSVWTEAAGDDFLCDTAWYG